MLGDSATSSAVLGSSGDADVAPTTTVNVSESSRRHDGIGEMSIAGTDENSGEEDRGRGGGGGGGGGGGDDGERSFGGNRWPRQETLALLKIRSEMDVAFRDATVKGPLWEQVSRKLGELGYHRSAKKCKEKFENVYKYHKRTKEVRSGKSDGKTYKFFDQLQALETHPPPPPPPPNFHSHTAAPPHLVSSTMAAPPPQTTVNVISHINTTTVSSTTSVPHLMNISFSQPNPTIHLQSPPPPPPPPPNLIVTPTFQTAGAGFRSVEADLISNSTSSSSSTSSDEEASRGRTTRKRKWKDFFEGLMREVIQKQEEMQRRFLEAIEKRENERFVREETWRIQEMAKINKEREILERERSMAAAKDAAITSFLQKITENQQTPNPSPTPATAPPPAPPPPPPPPPPPSAATPAPAPAPAPPQSKPQLPISTMQILPISIPPQPQTEIMKTDYNVSPAAPSSSRWPKVEVEALIKLRTNLEGKYLENGPKGPLWEEISSAMRRLGYNRNAKRCKEKWENINKYFKKVKESKKSRREDSKTCPYFEQLDALYKDKINNNNNNGTGATTPLLRIQHQQQQPLMVRPEQQWPPQQQEIGRPDSGTEEMESEPLDRDDRDDDDDGEDEDEEEEDDGGGNYEIVASKPASLSAAE